MNTPITQTQQQELLDKAEQALKNSYSPYSHFKVGACVLAENGKFYCGTNIENSSYGLTVCAERNAIFAAASDGQRKFRALALVTNKVPGAEFNSPCGACRQVMSEFFEPETPVYMAVLEDGRRTVFTRTFNEVLPFPFPKLSHE